MTSRRVVVSGVGMVSPVGNSAEAAWRAVASGQSGIGLVGRFDASGFPSRVAGEVRGFCPEQWMSPRDVSLSDPFLHYAVAAATMAIDDSGLMDDERARTRTGTCIATAAGGTSVLLAQHAILASKGPRFVSPMTVPFSICDMASGYVSIKFKLEGPNHSLVSACASGASAVGEAFHMITRGSVDAMVAGASDAIVPLHLAAFASAQALTTQDDEPCRLSRPFDRGRSGFVMSEGAAVLVLEERERARSRGARIYAEVAGYGSCADGHHITAPDASGRGAARAMCEAIGMAGIAPRDVGYVNAHATSTLLGDRAEVAALRHVFGGSLDAIPVSSTKSTTGHMLGAAGAAEAIFSIYAMRDRVLPPTINQDDLDPDCDVDSVPNVARPGSPAFVLSNSFGFGGHNTTLIFRHPLA